VTENQLTEHKSHLLIRVPVSANGYVSIYFSNSDGTQMNEREWWHLRQVVEMASKAFAKPEEKVQAAAAGV
jgi:hypothetical protein